MKISSEFSDYLMQQAIIEAKKAYSLNEVPIGAVIAHCSPIHSSTIENSTIIARAHNLVENNQSVVQHAEVLAIQEASKKLNNWRLSDCILCVTIEPCTMCSGAIKLSRIGTVIFGAYDPSMGACGSLYDLLQDPRPGPVQRVISGVREDECATMLKDFFKSRRAVLQKQK